MKKQARKPNRKKSAKRPTMRPEQRQNLTVGQWISRVAKWLFGAISLTGVAASVNAYYATYPEVEPQTEISQGLDDLPFVISNQSNWFDMRDVKISCSISNITWQSGLHHWIRAVGEMHPKIPANLAIIPAGEDATYECHSTNIAILYPSPTGKTLPPEQIHRFPIDKTEVRILISYRTNFVLFSSPRNYRSEAFTWKRTEAGYRWLRGPYLQTSQVQP
jgi:hypothetical protein